MLETEFKNLMKELVELGEDKEEFSTLFELFDVLDIEGKKSLLESLKKERDILKKR